MTDGRRCAHCNADVSPDASACATCGKLTTPSTATEMRGGLSQPAAVFFGLIAGLVLGIAFDFLLMSGLTRSNTCQTVMIADGASLAAILMPILALVFLFPRVRAARKNLGLFLTIASIAFLVPTAPCTVGIIGFERC